MASELEEAGRDGRLAALLQGDLEVEALRRKTQGQSSRESLVKHNIAFIETLRCFPRRIQG
eukprot:2143255-Amphidinium_carterae.1